MKKYKIKIDTMTEVNNFCKLMNKLCSESLELNLKIKDDNGNVVSANSLLGVMYASSEFTDCFLYSSKEIYDKIKDFVI